MKQYKVLKTTMGRRYKERMSDQETVDQFLYHIALVAVPFISSALMFFLWVKMG